MSYIGTEPKDIRSFGRTKFDYTATQGQTAFTGADDDGKVLAFTVGQIEVYVNGILMDDSDFTTTGTGTVTLASAANLNDVVNVVSFESNIPDNDYVPASGGTFTGNVTHSGTLTASGAFTSQGIDDNATSTAMTLDSSGDVGIGNTVASSMVGTGSLTIGSGVSGQAAAYTVYSNSDTYGALYFADATSGTARYAGGVEYNHTNNQLSLSTQSAGRLVISEDGYVTKPSQPAFLARPTSNQNDIPNLNATTIAFGTEIFDRNADFNTSTSTFTAPVTGVYLFNFALRTQGMHDTSNYYNFELVTSNRGYQNILDPRAFDQDAAYWTIVLTVLADMDANDTAYVSAFQAFQSAQLDISTASHFSGYLVA